MNFKCTVWWWILRCVTHVIITVQIVIGHFCPLWRVPCSPSLRMPTPTAVEITVTINEFSVTELLVVIQPVFIRFWLLSFSMMSVRLIRVVGVSVVHLHILLKSLLSRGKFTILISPKDGFHNSQRLSHLWLLSRPALNLCSIKTMLPSNAQLLDHVQQRNTAGAKEENHPSPLPPLTSGSQGGGTVFRARSGRHEVRLDDRTHRENLWCQ